MTFVQDEPLTLSGGCHCSAIRYTISVPTLESRASLPIPPTPLQVQQPDGTTTSKPVRFPLITVDHCEDCRRVCGGLVMGWFICPTSWIQFSLLLREDTEAQRQDYPADEVVNPSSALLKTTYLADYNSSKDTHRLFCARCGTSLTFHYCGQRPAAAAGMPPIVDIALGTMDKESLEKEGVRPDRHIWWEDGSPWIKEILWKGSDGKPGTFCRMLRHPDGRVVPVVGED